MNLSDTESIDCPVCAHNSFTVKYRIRQWKIVQCNACAFVYVNPRLKKIHLFSLYKDHYFDNKLFGYYHYTENKELRKKNFAKWLADAAAFIPSNKNIYALDIGCATGYCLELMRQKGWKPEGIELDPGIAQEVAAQGYKVYDKPFLENQYGKQYSVITLFDVVEHLTDLPEHFQKLHDILEADGCVIIVTPDYDSTQRKLFGRKWFQFKPLEHINYFTLETLSGLAEKAGFTVVKQLASGQFCDRKFLENRLRKYRLTVLTPLLHIYTKWVYGKKEYFYVDTASRYVVLQKKQSV